MSLPDRIVLWLRDQLTTAGAEGFTFGLSGGVDSATVAALAVRAVGPERVLAAILPCHSLPEDARLAQRVAETFGIPTVTVDLSGAYDALLAALPPIRPPPGGRQRQAPPAHDRLVLSEPGVAHLSGAGRRQQERNHGRLHDQVGR